MYIVLFFFFFFQAEDGIRDTSVTGVQTCALPICSDLPQAEYEVYQRSRSNGSVRRLAANLNGIDTSLRSLTGGIEWKSIKEIGRASCREREEIVVVGGSMKEKGEKKVEGRRVEDT